MTLALSVAALPKALATPPIQLNYAHDHWRQTLHLYLPPPGPPTSGCPPHPLAIYIHGGGWLSGEAGDVAPYVQPLMNRRFAVASLNYRWSTHDAFPAQIHDCKGAIRFLRAVASQYNLDATKFVVFGDSAGGHLAALVATASERSELEGSVGGHVRFSSRVEAVADFSGPTDLFALANHPPHGSPTSIISKLFQWPIQDIIANMNNPEPPYPQLVALVHSANPITHVSADDPPFRIVHGESDDLIPLSQSQLLFDALVTTGVPSALVTIAGAGHKLPLSVYLPVFDFLKSAVNIRLADVNCDGVVGVPDLLVVISAWGPCPQGVGCNEDITGDGQVGVPDLLAVISDWG